MKKNLVTFDEKVRFTAIIMVALLSISRGGYWLWSGNSATSEQLAYVAPLEIWGIIFVVGGIFLIISNMFIFSPKNKKFFYLLFVIGTGILALSYLVVGMASVQNSINWLTPSHNTILFVGFMALFSLGAKELWKILKSKEV
ncbi:hypothetical protein [Staphylococcus phage PMBT8]|nr:hypothetical protein [Staphylococcus phage PMBT8]